MRADTHFIWEQTPILTTLPALCQPIQVILHEGTYVQLTKKEKKKKEKGVIYNWFFYNMPASPEDW